MTESTSTTATRVGADGAVEAKSDTPVSDVVVAQIPGANPDNFVSITLSNPLNARDREFLGLPVDASTEVGQRLRVSKNGAKAVIHAGYATIDPEDSEAVRNLVPSSPGVVSGEVADPAPVAPVEDAPSTPDVATDVDKSTSRKQR